MPETTINGRHITDWPSFHDVFHEKLGFPDFYARTIDAWVDCLSYLDDPEAEMCRVHVDIGEKLTLRIAHAADLRTRCPDIWKELIAATNSVNQRRAEQGMFPILDLLF